MPTVCGMCPVGCNVAATQREGKVRRILSRNHPEVDEGWLCDKGRFAYSHLYAPDRVTDPLLRRGPQVLAPVPWDEALDEAERLLRAAGTHIVTALSGSETVEQAYALAKLLRQGLGAHSALMPEVENARALDGFRRPLVLDPRRRRDRRLRARAARRARADRRSLGARREAPGAPRSSTSSTRTGCAAPSARS